MVILLDGEPDGEIRMGNPLMLRLRLRDTEGGKIENTQMVRHK